MAAEKENDGEATGLMTVGALIALLSEKPADAEVRIMMIDTDEDSGKDDYQPYPIMYVDQYVDDDAESPTYQQDFVGVVSDLRDDDDDDGDFADDGDADAGDDDD